MLRPASRVTPAALVALACAACADEPAPEPIEAPSLEVFEALADEAPAAGVAAPFMIETRSCAFALYLTVSPRGEAMFAMIHPQRTFCELWVGRSGEATQYCRYSRDERLVELGATGPLSLEVDDDAHCVRAPFGP